MADKKKDDKRGKNPGRTPAQRPVPMRNVQPREPPDQVPQDVKEALDVADEISVVIEEDVPEWKVLKNQKYFESTEERAKDIAKTIRQNNRVTDAQRTALDNILAGLRKWV